MPRRNVIEWLLVGKDRIGPAVQSAQGKFQQLGRSVISVQTAIGAALGGAAVVRFGTAIVEAGDRVDLLRARFQALTGSTAAFQELYDIAQDVGVAMDDVGATMARFALGTRELDLAASELGELTDTVLKLGRIGGASTQELAAGAMQLAQGLASGRLQGDELRSVMENLPLVMAALSDELGKNIAELREMGAQGQLTAEVITDTLLGVAEDVDEKFENLPRTLSQSRAEIGNEFTLLFAAVDESLKTSETFQFFTSSLVDAVQGLRVLLGDTSTREVGQASFDRLMARRMEVQRQMRILETGELDNGKKVALSIRERREQWRLLSVELGEITEKLRAMQEARVIEDTAKEVTKAVEAVQAFDPATMFDETGEAMQRATALVRDVDAEIAAAWAIARRDAARQEREGMEEEEKESFEKRMRVMTTIADQAARNMQDAFADFLFDPFDDGLDGMLKNFVDTMRRMFANVVAAQIFGALNIGGGLNAILPGFQHGGSFRVPGYGGPDSQLVAFRATPGEQVTVGHGGGSGMTVQYNIDARGATTDLIQALPGILERNNQKLLSFMNKRATQGGAMP